MIVRKRDVVGVISLGKMAKPHKGVSRALNKNRGAMIGLRCRVNITVEVDRVANALAIRTPIPMQLIHQGGQWRAECQTPPVATAGFDRLEEAILAGARQAAAEMQGAVVDRPLIVGKITPQNVPDELL